MFNQYTDADALKEIFEDLDIIDNIAKGDESLVKSSIV